MNFFLSVISLVLCVVSGLWCLASLRLALQRLQQSSYRNERYLRRLFGSDTALFFRDYRHVQVVGFFVLGLVMHLSADGFALIPLFCSLAAVSILLQRTRASYLQEKKPFVFTQRATRLAILAVGILLTVPVLVTIAFSLRVGASYMPLWAALTPLLLVVANMLVFPIETQVNNFYLRDAAKRRRAMSQLRVIGITGSYGKTSTKHFVHGILSRRLLSYMTPGSVNTELGLARELREKLQPVHEVFIAEMGAREPGDIQKCCEVAQPNWGILTCVGKAHLETFGSEEAIRQTKGELLRALPADGVCFLNANDPNTERMREFVPCRIVTFGLAQPHAGGFHADVFARDLSVTPEGSSFWVDGEKVSEPFEVHTQLLGRHNISNLIAAIAVAIESGLNASVIKAAVRALQPVEHRLQLMKKGDGILVIDDAFNSNPEGFREALDTLALFRDRRRVLVTPGMVELGGDEVDENRTIGKYAAARVDHVVLVGSEQRISPLREGLIENGFLEENIESVSDLTRAREHLTKFNKPGDIVLFENDLPDLYG